MKANQYKSRRMPLCGGIHPSGGFVAWPDNRFKTEAEKAGYELLKRKRLRKGFVAWPEKDKTLN